MCKKITLGVVAIAVVGGLMFGGRLIPYTQTAVQNMRQAAQGSVPIEFQIDAAKGELEKIGPEIKSMVHKVAKEKVQINRLAADLKRQDEMLSESYDEMMALREHLETGGEYYVATNSQKYPNSRVEEDLHHRFTLYKTAKATRDKQEEILRIREEAMGNALAKLDQAKAQQRELEVQLENLVARNRMNEVVASASNINIDDSQLARTRQMIDDIDATIAAEEEVLNIAPKYYGQIPVSEKSSPPTANVLEEMDIYFHGEQDDQADVDAELFDDEA